MIAIISCTKNKFKLNRVEARKLYSKSTLFKYSYLVIKKQYPTPPIYILSAKYGLIKETDIISYYDTSFKDKENRRVIHIPEDYVFVGSALYKQMMDRKPTVDIGVGLPIGKKVAYLKGLLK